MPADQRDLFPHTISGLTVVVLDANARVGGRRTLDLELADGVVTKGGGEAI